MFILDARLRKDDGRRGVAGSGFFHCSRHPMMSPSKLDPRVQDKESLFYQNYLNYKNRYDTFYNGE